jgi:hypothetical protein
LSASKAQEQETEDLPGGQQRSSKKKRKGMCDGNGRLPEKRQDSESEPAEDLTGWDLILLFFSLTFSERKKKHRKGNV